jgi:DNA-binding CsgD family transcriptional regulator
LIAALAIQVVAAIFFLGETMSEFRSDSGRLHSPTELTVALALVIGILLSIRELRLVLRRVDEQASALDIVRTTFARVIKRQFDLWKLTPAERAIARLSLEGLDVDEISKIRSAALGTIRAQFARIYSKSGVSNRAQFASIFLTELIGGTSATAEKPYNTEIAPNE